MRLDPGPDRLAELRSRLSPPEREREARYAKPADRDRYSTARGHLRELLGSALGSVPGDVKLVAGPRGKPALDPATGAPDLRFNLSHSGDLAAIALALGREVGVDVERRSAERPLESLAPRFMSPGELESWALLDAEEQVDEFFRSWTRREAYAKGRGEGLALELPAIELDPAPGEGGRWNVRGPEGDAGWAVADLDAGPGHAGAVAAEGRDWRLTVASSARA